MRLKINTTTSSSLSLQKQSYADFSIVLTPTLIPHLPLIIACRAFAIHILVAPKQQHVTNTPV